MASPAYVEALLGGVEAGLKRTLKAVFDYVLTNLRFGPATHQTRSENLQAYYLLTTTPAVAGTEFSIAHGLGRTPYLALPVLPLSDVGSQLVPLTVSRAPDASRVYFTSTAANAPVAILIEG